MPLYGHGLIAIRVDRVFAALPQQVEPVPLKVYHQVPTLDRQPMPLPALAPAGPLQEGYLDPVACTPPPFLSAHP